MSRTKKWEQKSIISLISNKSRLSDDNFRIETTKLSVISNYTKGLNNRFRTFLSKKQIFFKNNQIISNVRYFHVKRRSS